MRTTEVRGLYVLNSVLRHCRLEASLSDSGVLYERLSLPRLLLSKGLLNKVAVR